MSEVIIYFRQSEVETVQFSQQLDVSEVAPELTPLVAVAVTHTALTPQ